MRARIEQDNEEYRYREYVTEILRLRVENKTLTKSWTEIIDPKPVDDRSGDEIAIEFVRRMKNGGD